MGKDTTAAGGTGKVTGGIPLTRKDHHKSLGVSKAATGKDHYEIVGVNKAALAVGGDGKRPRGVGGAKGMAGAVAPTFSRTDLKTAVKKVTSEFHHEEEHRGSFQDERSTFSYTHRSTTAVKVTNEYRHEDQETLGLREDGHKQEGEDMQDGHEDNDGAEMGDDRSGGGDDGYYIEDAGMRDVGDCLNGDHYYYDVAAAGFDDGYDDDGGDGSDYWW